MESAFSFKIFLYLIILFSAVFHEYMHAWMANFLGDTTAKYAGRLTLNPIKHIDPVGTVILPLLLLFTAGAFIGWAKPVPFNPYNLRNQKYGAALVGIAGPAANIFLAIVFGLILRFTPGIGFLPSFFNPTALLSILGLIVYINIFLALFNLLPVPPLDGSKLIAGGLPRSLEAALSGSFIGIMIAVFVAMTILAPLSRLIFWVIVGVSPF